MRPFALTLLLVALWPATAGAGTFRVYGLGLNSAGCPSGWKAHTPSPAKLSHRDLCSRWEIQSNRDGTALEQGDFATASMFTGEGARFTGFSIRSSGAARNGAIWQMGMCRSAYTDCRTSAARSGDWAGAGDSLGVLGPGGALYDARHLYAGGWCLASACADSAQAGRALDVMQNESHAVVDDYTRPGEPAIGGVSTGWNSGAKQVTFTASDMGSGVASVTLTVDGSLHRTVNQSCARLPSGGYSHPVPCATAVSGELALNEPGRLADGHHSLAVAAHDAGDELGVTTSEFWVDNNAPGHPLDLTVVGGDGWRAANGFALGWEAPRQGDGSPIVAAYYKVGSPPVTPTDGTRVADSADTGIDGVRVPADGDWAIYVWLEDAAGNVHHANAAAAHLRLDAASPTLGFSSERDDHSPAEVRVAAADADSGVAGGRIDIRRRGAAEWRALETRREGTGFVTSIPDDRLGRGTYELRATAWDGVGNGATTTRRADGREMVLELPLRADTLVHAGLSTRRGGATRGDRALAVAYRDRAWLRGSVRSGARPLPDAPIGVYTRPLTGGAWRLVTELVTDGHGRYALRLARGPSRELRVRFQGNRALRPGESLARLSVRAWAGLRLRPRRLRRGGTMSFVGRVGLLDARVPPRGKLIQIQYLDARRWRPAVKLGHTDSRGRFSIDYRFRRISRPTRIHFRILVPSEGGWPYATGWSRRRIAHVGP